MSSNKRSLASLVRAATCFHQSHEYNVDDSTTESGGKNLETDKEETKTAVDINHVQLKMSDSAAEAKPSSPLTIARKSPPKEAKSKEPPKEGKDTAKAIRDEIRNYIRNERDTDLKLSMALTESLKIEDKRRSDFLLREVKKKTTEIPTQIQKFISSLKQACKRKIVNKGGTPHSIIRSAFVYWDTSKEGMLSAEALQRCVMSIGVRLSQSDVNEVMQFYATGGNMMSYGRLLDDVLVEEPGLMSIRSPHPSARNEEDSRLIQPMSRNAPPMVKLFVEAVRSVLAKQMRDRGGTIESLLRNAFLMSDNNYSNALDQQELIKCLRQRLGISISPQQANEVMKFYDTKGVGEIDYKLLSEDVTSGHPRFIQHPIVTARTANAHYQALTKNPFFPQPFKPVPNKTVEQFKHNLHLKLESIIKAKGGSMRSWLEETLIRYDPKLTGFVTDWSYLQGSMRRLGLTLTEEEARTVMRSYEDTSGKVPYDAIIRDAISGEGGIIESGTEGAKTVVTATARAPKPVTDCVKRIRSAVNPFGRKSKGVLNPRDVLHGTFLRFDASRTGRLTVGEVQLALAELHVSASEEDVTALVNWYDTNGNRRLDYAELTRQIFGDDPFLRQSKSTLLLPKLSMDSLSPSKSSAVLSTSGSSSSQSSQANEIGIKETRRQKAARAAFIRNQIMSEKVLLQQKLQAVEKQRLALLQKGSS